MASEKEKRAVWGKAKKIPGRDPAKYRRDPYGKIIYYDSHGKQSPMGWESDHIRPKARGGSDSIRNKQALNTKANRKKSDSLQKRSRHSKRNK